MIAPAPLSDLQTALSRRAAIFGATVTLAAVPTVPALAAPRWDADLVALGVRLRIVMEGARRALEPVPNDEHDGTTSGSTTPIRSCPAWRFAQIDADLVELGGAVDLDNAVPNAPGRWQFWTVADIDAERLQRHPEMAPAGGAI